MPSGCPGDERERDLKVGWERKTRFFRPEPNPKGKLRKGRAGTVKGEKGEEGKGLVKGVKPENAPPPI